MNDRPQIKKIRALWIALHHLGEVRDPSDQAMGVFAKGVTGKAALQWSDAADLAKVTEALRAWCARAGFEVPDQAMEKESAAHRAKYGFAPLPGAAAKAELINVLWHKLIDAGVFTHGIHARLDTWMHRETGRPVTTPIHLPAEWFDPLIERLGKWLRKQRSKT